MAISIEFKDKYVYFGPEAGLHTQGEARAEVYDVTGPRYHDGHDLSAMTWYVRASHPDYMTLINKQLRVSVDPDNEGQIIITWPVEADFTAYAGQLDVHFVGKSSTGEEIIKLQSNGLQFAASVEGTAAPPKNVFENTLEQMQGLLDNAENAAAQSAADASRAENAQEAAGQSAQTAQQAQEGTAQSVVQNQALVQQIEGDAEAAAASAAAAAASAAKAEQLAQGCKGWFVNVAALRAAYPTGTDGEWAILGSTDSIWVWDADSSDWINSHKTTDLSDYYTKEQADGRFLQIDGDGAAVTVPFTVPASLPALPSSPATLESLMTMLASMRNRLAALEESMPGIGEWWYSPNVITYTGGVNSKAFARVNFNDDLSKTVYAVLYAKIGDSLSSGAADGFFNCKKLAERFPLAYGANFQRGAVGGEKEHKLSIGELPVISGTITPHWSEEGTTIASVGGVFSATGSNAAYRDGGSKVSGTSSVKVIKLAFGEGKSHNTLPPYLAQNIIVRAL